MALCSPKHFGRKYWGKSEFDGWLDWFVFDAPINRETFEYIANHANFSGGAGALFAGFPSIRRRGSRVLVTVRGGYDC